MLSVKECILLLRQNDSFLIITHIRPDGDTICSAAGLCLALRSVGKTAFLFDNPDITEKYREITDRLIAPSGYKPSYTVAVDMASRTQCPVDYTEGIQLCIDHHVSNTLFAENSLIMPELSSCGELLLLIVKEMGVLDKEIASMLYIAVSTDTGCFCYGNTNAATHAAASELIEAGAENGRLNKSFFRTASRERIMLEGVLYSNIEYAHGGKIAISKITMKMLEEIGASEDDCEDIASLPGRISGVLIGITIRECAPRTSKISIRTTPLVSANKICSRFGGGGHPMAGGCTMEANPDEAANIILRACEEELK